MAVDDDLGAGRQPELHLDFLGIEIEHAVHVEVDRPGDVPLPRVARVPERAVELVVRTHVDHRHLAESPYELVELDVTHSPRTTSTSAATDGRRLRSSTQLWSRDGSLTPSMSRALSTHGTKAMSLKRLIPTGRDSSRAASS